MKLHEAEQLIEKKKWSKGVDKKWEAPAGFFGRGAEAIAKGLKRAHPDLKSATASLNFYINRGGKNLSAADKKRLESAKETLHGLYSKD